MNTKALLAAMAIVALPTASQAQSWFGNTMPTYPGVYFGAEGAANWLLNSGTYYMDVGWAAGGKIGYDLVGPRVEAEVMYRANNGTGLVFFPGGAANVRGRIEQISAMANLLYDFFPGAVLTPYLGGGLGVAFSDATIQCCYLCSTRFAFQGILGFGYNATPALRIGVEGRYFGTTTDTNSPYSNNNVMALLSVSYKFGQPEAPPPPPPPPVAPPSFMVFFDWDKSNLSQQALATIQQAADAFRQKGNARITATGHTDTSGPESYNMALSLRRANAVKDALVRDDVPAQAITVIGMGEKGLLVPTGDG
ncbi:MAG: OmpA family protein, partial [Alphaproteobacteria bacterium]|nr:OmpA family protein [Alphaproteobacteria bacterium]